jgi:hypothetical protein
MPRRSPAAHTSTQSRARTRGDDSLSTLLSVNEVFAMDFMKICSRTTRLAFDMRQSAVSVTFENTPLEAGQSGSGGTAPQTFRPVEH